MIVKKFIEKTNPILLKTKAAVNLVSWHVLLSCFWLWTILRMDLKNLDLADI
jgi:hypothetical protein